MKKLLTILFTLITAVSFGQFVTQPAVVATTTQMKNYNGPSRLVFVSDSAYQGFYYVYTGSVAANEATIFAGAGGKKWRRSIVPEIYAAANENIGEWGTFTGDIADQTDLVDALALKANVANPSFTGNGKIGAGVSMTIFNGTGAAFTPDWLISSTAGDQAGMAVGVNDGTANRRLGLFVDQTNGVVGLSQAQSTSALPFVYRNSGGEWFRIATDGTIRLHKYNTTAGYMKNGTDGTLSSVTSIPKADVGLSNVDNTSDLNKPISTATQTALNNKQDNLISGANIKTLNNQTLLGAGDIPISLPTRVFLGSDVANSTESFANVTGLSFPVEAAGKYEFEFFIVYNAAATTTGAAFSLNGPTLTSLNYISIVSLSTTSRFANVRSTYNTGTETSNSISSNNIANVTGVIECSAGGTVTATFKSGVAGSAITVKAGNTYVKYTRIN